VERSRFVRHCSRIGRTVHVIMTRIRRLKMIALPASVPIDSSESDDIALIDEKANDVGGRPGVC